MNRFERKPEDERKSEKLTERYTAIIEHVFTARYLTINLVNRLCFLETEMSWTKEHLRNLFDWGYLKKREVPKTAPDIFFLGLKGKRHIGKLDRFTRDEIDRIAGVPGGNEPPMGHDLTLSRLYVASVLQCRRYNWSLTWRNTRMIQLDTNMGIEPDAYLCVEGQSGTHEAMIEFTDALPSKEAMRDKLARYRDWWEREKPMPILWFTTSENRAKILRQAVASFVFRDYIMIGLVDHVSEFLTKKMWWWGEGGEVVNWITPPAEVLYPPAEKV